MARVLFLGEIGRGQTSLMRMRAIERLGHQVRGIHTIEPWLQVPWLQRQLQRRLGRGSVVNEINQVVLEAARGFRPDYVWAEKQEYLRAQTIEDMRRLGARLVHFTPDPYFSLDWKRTRLMNEAIRAFDVLVYCKSYEKTQYEAIGKPLVYMPLGYCDQVHRPLHSEDPRWLCDIGFLGGWEPRRERLLRAVAGTDLKLKIWGIAWDFLRDGRWTVRRQFVLSQLAGNDSFAIHSDPLLAVALQGAEVYADDYARALTGAKIGLGLLRTICADQHTTRSFEIPACGSMLLADRTEEHEQLFEEGKEAEFFSSDEECLDKLQRYCNDDAARQKLAYAGLRRCEVSGYSYVHRLARALEAIEKI